MNELARINTFIRVVDAGGFSAAARGVSSISAVARQVQSLESELGVRLLHRSTRRVSLTEPGRRFLERARSIANDLTSAKLEAKSYQDTMKGTLKVSLRVSAGTTIVVPALQSFLARYPELSVEVVLTDDNLDLISNCIDVAVWSGTLPDCDLVARRLKPARQIVCASPEYLMKRGTPRKPEDLRFHDCLLSAGCPSAASWRFSRDGQQRDVEVRGSLRTDSWVALLTAALSGIGVIVVNEWIVSRSIARGQLVRLFDDYAVNSTLCEDDFNVVYPSGRQLSRKVRTFVDFLIQLFGEQQVATCPATADEQRAASAS